MSKSKKWIIVWVLLFGILPPIIGYLIQGPKIFSSVFYYFTYTYTSIAYACSGFGIVLASIAKTRQQVQGYSTIIVMVMSAIGGSMIPIFVMPEILQKMAMFSVNYWGIQGIYDIFWKLVPLTDITFLSRVFVLLCIGSFLNFVALLLFKRNMLRIA